MTPPVHQFRLRSMANRDYWENVRASARFAEFWAQMDALCEGAPATARVPLAADYLAAIGVCAGSIFQACEALASLGTERPQARARAMADLRLFLERAFTLGGYSGQKRTILMVVVPYHEVGRLKALIKAVDPHAFIILLDTTEVLGQVFKLHC